MDNFKIAVYPYSSEVDPILNYIYLLRPQYEIKSLISLKGFGYDNKKITLGKADFKNDIIIHTSLDKIENDVNCIFIPEFENEGQFEFEMINNINSIIKKIKKIICAAKLKKETLKKLKNICFSRDNKIELEIKNDINENNINKSKIYYKYFDYLENISVPIVLIAGMWENVDKFYISLALRDIFLKHGYKVSQIGSRSYCEMMGFHSFPRFMLNPKIDEVKKVILFNRFIKNIYEIEKSDIIIISIPGAVQSYNSIYTNKFGILHYLISKAIIIDFLIMCTFYENDGVDFFNLISKSCIYKFGCPVDFFHMSNNRTYLVMDKMENNYLPRTKVDEILEKYYNKSSFFIANVLSKSGINKLYEQIINKLTINKFNTIN